MSLLSIQVPRRWMQEQEYNRIARNLAKDTDIQRKSFSKEQMVDAYETYLNEREKQLQDLQVRTLVKGRWGTHQVRDWRSCGLGLGQVVLQGAVGRICRRCTGGEEQL